MLATKQPEHCLTPLFRHTTLLLILLALLSGCSIYPKKGIDSEESTPSTKQSQDDKAKKSDAAPDGKDKHSQQDSEGSETKTEPGAEGTQPLCVYETTKGIAEVKDINKETPDTNLVSLVEELTANKTSDLNKNFLLK